MQMQMQIRNRDGHVKKRKGIKLGGLLVCLGVFLVQQFKEPEGKAPANGNLLLESAQRGKIYGTLEGTFGYLRIIHTDTKSEKTQNKICQVYYDDW